MLSEIKKHLLSFTVLLVVAGSVVSQNIDKIDYHFVYVALCQDDNTNYQKLIVELKKLNSELENSSTDCVLYFSKGMTQFSTANLKEWESLYSLLNGNNITNLYAAEEVENVLQIFANHEFSKIKNQLLTTDRYYSVTWHTYVGNGFWQAQYNKSIIGILVASCGINDKFGGNFQLYINHDSNDPIFQFERQNALGKYYSFLTDANTELKQY